MEAKLCLRAGFAEGDITPPLAVGFLASSVERRWDRFKSVRLRLAVKVAAFESDSERVALVSLDLLGLTTKVVGEWKTFKDRLASISEGVVPAHNIILTSTHTHSAPETLGLTNLYRQSEFKLWINDLTEQIGTTIRNAFEALEECRLTFAVGQVADLTVYRRIKTKDGIQLSHLFNELRPEYLVGKPMDDRLKMLVVRRKEDSEILGLIVHAVCHPVYEMCASWVSSDFAGELSLLAASNLKGVPLLFLNGAAGNINPRTLSGPPAAKVHASKMWRAISKMLSSSKGFETSDIRFLRKKVYFPSRSPEGIPNTRPKMADISGLSIGPVTFLFLPGEPFIETALSIEDRSLCDPLMIVGYAENWIGYIPTNLAFREGGYETGPGRWSTVQIGAEPILLEASLELLKHLSGKAIARRAIMAA